MLKRGAAAALALAVALYCWATLEAAYDGVLIERSAVGATPVTIYRADEPEAPPRPVVVIAHGFAGSQRLMEPFALTLARSGFIAATFDFLGHGDNAAPLTGDVTKEEGATAALTQQLSEVVDAALALPEADGRVGLLGHSMASDIVARLAVARPEIQATVGVSMFSKAVTATAPRNLLLIVGGYERFLSERALADVSKAIDGDAQEGRTYGAFADGTARRAVFADGVEHVGVLYSRESLTEARGWFAAAFDVREAGAPDVRGPLIIGLLLSVFALAWPLSALLPRSERAAPPPIRAQRLERYGLALIPAAATPLLLQPAPTDFLPILVADYLALHFLLYGGITLALLWGRKALSFGWPTGRLLASIAAVAGFGVFAIGLPIDAYVTAFMPHAGRWGLIAMLLVGACLYTLSDAWLTDGQPLDVRVATKLFFLASLALAIALNLEKLFFLIIIFPIIGAFFLLYGLIGRWVTQATGHPSVSGIANGIAFAWALGVVFPILAG